MLSYFLRIGCVFLAVGLLAVPSPSLAVLFYGSLSYPTGLEAQGGWRTTIGEATAVRWRVSDEGSPGWWSYRYELTHPPGKTSRVILETSLEFILDEIANVQVNDGAGNLIPYVLLPGDLGTHTPAGGNDGMPTDIYGIIFDREIRGVSTTIQFDSRRKPGWGDFYARGDDMLPIDATWNLGFAEDDPLDPAGIGAAKNHLLVPNGLVEPIPEPASLILLGTGLLAAAGLRRRKS